ncbi:MAG: D-alanyl-D-alanine carboxypeptidase/D-alanyl-D-alanine-endopeptidase, partial [Cyanobacteria bacterium J149]
SNNLYAEILLSYLATNPDTKFIAQKKILENLGLFSHDYSLKDASGLSRQNLVTPRSLVTLLKLMDKTEYAKTFRDSLSLAGVNGTLKNRFQNEDIINNNLWGKTGTLTGVSALSGYLQAKDDDIIFSIMVNNSSAPSKELRDTIDRLVVTVAQSQHCKNYN